MSPANNEMERISTGHKRIQAKMVHGQRWTPMLSCTCIKCHTCTEATALFTLFFHTSQSVTAFQNFRSVACNQVAEEVVVTASLIAGSAASIPREAGTLATVLTCDYSPTHSSCVLRTRFSIIGRSNPQGPRDGDGSSSASCGACCSSCAPNSRQFSQNGRHATTVKRAKETHNCKLWKVTVRPACALHLELEAMLARR